jgi:hypothetical protein
VEMDERKTSQMWRTHLVEADDVGVLEQLQRRDLRLYLHATRMID